jgi:hypothetical protein
LRQDIIDFKEGKVRDIPKKNIKLKEPPQSKTRVIKETIPVETNCFGIPRSTIPLKEITEDKYGIDTLGTTRRKKSKIIVEKQQIATESDYAKGILHTDTQKETNTPPPGIPFDLSYNIRKKVMETPTVLQKFTDSPCVESTPLPTTPPESKLNRPTKVKIRTTSDLAPIETLINDYELIEIDKRLEQEWKGEQTLLDYFVEEYDLIKKKGYDVTKVIKGTMDVYAKEVEKGADMTSERAEIESRKMIAAYIWRQTALNKINDFTTKANIKSLISRDLNHRIGKGKNVTLLSKDKIKERCDNIRATLIRADKNHQESIKVLDSIEKSLINNRSAVRTQGI